MEQIRNSYKILMIKPEGNRTIGDRRMVKPWGHRWSQFLCTVPSTRKLNFANTQKRRLKEEKVLMTESIDIIIIWDVTS
jgi:hypothetical protein